MSAADLDFDDAKALLTFFVPGIPAPGGSKSFMGLSKRTGRAILMDAGGQRNKDWRACVSLAGWQAAHGNEAAKALMSGPIHLSCDFIMPRPKKHFHTSKKLRGQLRADAPKYHTSAPDTTKLLRSTEDALKGITWTDDSQVATQFARKTYGETTGCHITITQL